MVPRWMLAGYNVFGIFHRLSGFFDKVIKLLRARGIQATSPRLHCFIKNIFTIDVVEQSSGGPKQSQEFFIHVFPLYQIRVSASILPWSSHLKPDPPPAELRKPGEFITPQVYRITSRTAIVNYAMVLP